MIPISDQIRYRLLSCVPYLQNSLSKKYQATSFSISSNKVRMQFASSFVILDKIFSIYNIKIKNYVSSIQVFQSYIEVKFQKRVKVVTINGKRYIKLKGFNEIAFNIDYEVMSDDGDVFLLVKPTSLPIINLTGNGFCPTEYSTNLNGLKSLTFNSPYYEFEFDLQSIYYGDIDMDYMPIVVDANDNVVAWNYASWIKSESEAKEEEYLIIDTSSLVRDEVRSMTNQSDSLYDIDSKTFTYRNSYRFDIYHSMIRFEGNNQNYGSGYDVMTKQIELDKFLIGALTGFKIDFGYGNYSSNIMPNRSENQETIETGRVANKFACYFTLTITDKLSLILDENSYKINEVKINQDQIIFA